MRVWVALFIGVVVGMFLGTNLGVVIVCLMQSSAHREESAQRGTSGPNSSSNGKGSGCTEYA